MTLHRLNHALAFVFGGYQDYEKFYSTSMLEEDSGLFVAIMEQLAARKNQSSNALIDSGGGVDSKDPQNTPPDEDDDPEGAVEKMDQEPDIESTDPTTPETSHPPEQATLESSHRDRNPSIFQQVEMTGEEVNGVRLALAHVQLQRLKGHRYNVFEAAFFYDPDGDRGEYFLNIIQVAATYAAIFFMFYFLGNQIRKIYKERNVFLKDEDNNDKEWLGILSVNAIGLGYFFFLLGRDIERVQNFTRCVLKLCPYDKFTSYQVKSHRWWCIFNNICVNVYMGYGLFFLNFFFVQSADDMVDAILQAIAVVFIIQIDDIIPVYIRIKRRIHLMSIPCIPLLKVKYWFDWENRNIHPKLMAVVEKFLSHPDWPHEAVTVQKTTGDTVVFRETDVAYFFVNKSDSVIRIFHGRMRKHTQKYKHLFEEVTYRIDGRGAEAFLNTMSKFACVEEEEGPKKLEVDSNVIKRRSVPSLNLKSKT